MQRLKQQGTSKICAFIISLKVKIIGDVSLALITSDLITLVFYLIGIAEHLKIIKGNFSLSYFES